MQTLRLACVGPAVITVGEQPISGALPAKALALLCYLAITGQPHSRAALAGLLWGELPEDDARGNLRSAVASLRPLVGDHLHITRDTLAFDRTAPYWLDVELVERGAATAGTTFGDQQLRDAVALIRGELLHGLFVRGAPDWDDWLTGQRERLHQLALHVLHQVATHALEQGAYADGIDAATRLLALEPWHEDGHRLVMRLLALAGRPEAALAHYDHCRALLSRELGAEPALETTLLAEQIRSGALRVAPAPGRPRHNLPVQRLPLIGRAYDVAAVSALLARDDIGIVTLVGPGGVGKTRLALEVAHAALPSFPDGVWLVDLAPISDADLVLPTIMKVLGVEPAAQDAALDSLQAALRDTTMLLLLDNLEQVLAAAPLLSELLAAVPKLKLLATSRVRLPLYGSYDYPVAPLALPPARDDRDDLAAVLAPAEVQTLGQVATVDLFVQRAHARDPGFTLTPQNVLAVAALCTQLDGLPLAIELAAARVSLYSPQVLVERLHDRFAVLIGGPSDRPERQRTLRATVAWSYDLLAPPAQALFRRLAVFIGGYELALVERVVPDERSALDGMERAALPELLELLVAASLVRRLPDVGAVATAGEPRFGMLETIRAYALEQLEQSGEQAAVRQRHFAAFLALAEAAGLEDQGRAHADVLRRLERDHDNFRAALGWAEHADQPELVLRLGSALGAYWLEPAYRREGRRWLEHGLAQCDGGPDVPPLLSMRAHHHAGVLATWQLDYGAATAHLEASLALAREQDDDRMIARSLYELGSAAYANGDYARAVPLLTDSLERGRTLHDPAVIMQASGRLGIAATVAGHYAHAVTLLDESLELVDQLDDEYFRCRLLIALATSTLQLGELERAQRLAGEVLLRLQAIGDRSLLIFPYLCFAGIAAEQSNARRGARMLGILDQLSRSLGTRVFPGVQAIYTTVRASLEQQLGDAAFGRAWAEGGALTLEQAAAEALDRA